MDREVTLVGIQRGLRLVVRWMFVGLLLFAIGIGFAVWRVNAVSSENRRLITKVDTLNRAQANRAYETCQVRNQNQKADIDHKLNLALLDDRFVKGLQDRGAAAIVKERAAIYRKAIEDTGATLTPPDTKIRVLDYGLPPCMKPDPGPTK